MTEVAIVDYGMCNLGSIARAVEECGASALVSERPADLERATHIILPGVGSFREAMTRLRERGLDQAMEEQARGRGIPFLGICLGMQMLASRGYEGRETRGLGWIEGEVRRLEAGAGERVPHVGWNEVEQRRSCPLFDGIADRKDFYFVHSYYFLPEDDGVVVARTPYAGGFVSAVGRQLIFGVQFHPEKSQRPGLGMLRNFLAL